MTAIHFNFKHVSSSKHKKVSIVKPVYCYCYGNSSSL